MRVGIIGTAGRGADGAKMSAELFQAMLANANEIILGLVPDQGGMIPLPVTVVSGGAAWADHVAVVLFRRGMVSGLELHLPAGFRSANECLDASSRGRYAEFFGNKDADVANRYHHAFSRAVGGNTLRGIADALDRGAKVKVHAGLKARNLFVGAVDVLIAYTWGPSPDVPKDGGTKHTWDHSTAARKIHVPLSTLAGERAQGALPTGSAEVTRPVSIAEPPHGPHPADGYTYDGCLGCHPDRPEGTERSPGQRDSTPAGRAYRTDVIVLCECGHPSQDHDPWPDCIAILRKDMGPGELPLFTRCPCREWRPVQ